MNADRQSIICNCCHCPAMHCRHTIEQATEDGQFSIDIALPQERIAMEVCAAVHLSYGIDSRNVRCRCTKVTDFRFPMLSYNCCSAANGSPCMWMPYCVGD